MCLININKHNWCMYNNLFEILRSVFVVTLEQKARGYNEAVINFNTLYSTSEIFCLALALRSNFNIYIIDAMMHFITISIQHQTSILNYFINFISYIFWVDYFGIPSVLAFQLIQDQSSMKNYEY